MKVLLINSVCGYGSTGRIVVELSEMLIKNGDDALIAYGRKYGSDNVPSVNISGKLGTLFHVFLTRMFDRHGFGSARATKKLINIIDDYEPDVIHLHNLHGYYLNIELLMEALYERDIRLVWTLHDCWAFTGHCSHFDYIGCDKWQTRCANCPQIHEYPKSWFSDHSKRNFCIKAAIFNMPKDMTIITPSYWLAGKVKNSFLNRYPIVTIHTGIDYDIFNPTPSNLKEELGLADKKILLGVASAFTERKGIDDFITLSERLPDHFHILLVGQNKEGKALPEKITMLTELLDAKKIAMLYSLADVFVNPTKEDTFPTVNLEALACGTPVVTYNTGGCIEVVNNSCGAIVARDDIDGIIEAVETIISKPIKENNCVKRALDFSKQTQLNLYNDIYKN